MKRQLIKKIKALIAVPGDFSGELCYDYAKLKSGQILCVNQVTPFMIEAITKAKGIIVKRRNLVQHATTIAREFNVPCVVGATEIMRIQGNFAIVRNLDEINAEIEVYKDVIE